MDINMLTTTFGQIFGIVRAYQKEKQHKQLSRYVLRQLKDRNAIYNEEYFDRPNIRNTSVLRDFVHHKLTKEHLACPRPSCASPRVSPLQLLKWLEKMRYRLQCGGLAKILYGIYRGFGYGAVLSDWVDKDPSYYTDSHVLVEVYIPDLNKYVIQDPSFNMMVTLGDSPIGTLDLMSLLRNREVVDSGEIVFINNQHGEEGVFTPVKDLNYEKYIKKYFGQVFRWVSGSTVMYPAVKTCRISTPEYSSRQKGRHGKNRIN